MAAQAVQTTSLWSSYPGTFLKNSAIGAVIGFAEYFLIGKLVKPLCDSKSGSLSDYLCLRAAKFFDLDYLSFIGAPFAFGRSLIVEFVEPFIPNLFILPKSCPEFKKAILEAFESDVVKAKYPLKELSEYKELAHQDFIHCCFLGEKSILSLALAEELIFRVGIQKTALLWLAKFCPDRIQKTLKSAPTRIFITSVIFASIHALSPEHSILSQFLGSLTYGILYEKFGLVSTITAHSLWNTLAVVNSDIKSVCERRIAASLIVMKKEMEK